MATPSSGAALLEPLKFGGLDEFGHPLEWLKDAVFPTSPPSGDLDLSGLPLDESDSTGSMDSGSLGEPRDTPSASGLTQTPIVEGFDELGFPPERSTEAAFTESRTAGGEEGEVIAAAGAPGEKILLDSSLGSGTGALTSGCTIHATFVATGLGVGFTC